jgi:ceramide glucosyltransferase
MPGWNDGHVEGKKFRVGLDMRVVEIKERGKNIPTPEVERARSKDRVD